MPARGSLRASDEDRERIIERLHKAATEGRLAAEELEQRVTTALKARTYDELNATVVDLPGPSRRSEHRGAVERRSTGRWVASTVAHNPMLLLFAIPVLAVTAAMLVAVTVMWAVLMVVVLVLGGRPRVASPPWIYARRQAMRQVRRRTGGYWA
jgi:cation transport ATPase